MQVELDLFSGRPNPRWNLTPAQTAEFQAALNALPVTNRTAPENDGLGYRGFVVTDPTDVSLRIVAYAGWVSVAHGGRHEVRQDDARTLERWLRDSGAPYLDSVLLQRVPVP